jgi:hypothetical protein
MAAVRTTTSLAKPKRAVEFPFQKLAQAVRTALRINNEISALDRGLRPPSPSFRHKARRSAMGTFRVDPTLMPRIRATKVLHQFPISFVD